MENMFFYYQGRFCGDRDLRMAILDASDRLYLSLSHLDLAQVGLSEYNQRYLKENLDNATLAWCVMTYMFSYLLALSYPDRKRLTFVDYGAGSGKLCLMAKALGVGKVIYVDIYDVSCKDAQKLGKYLGLEADYYLCGDIDDLIGFLRNNRFYCDIFASHDCIEHIYNIEAFLHKVSLLSAHSMVMWLSSFANPLRRKTRNTLSKVAVKAEYQDKEKKWGHKERDSLRSFFSTRQEIIRKSGYGYLNADEITALAKKTRGMREDDILMEVKNYLQYRMLPPDPSHPTNTCDPKTGNWAERLMNPFSLAKILCDHGLQCQVLPGYWSPDTRSILKDLAKRITNFWISHSGRIGLKSAPYYVLLGKSKPK